ncbi:hypothetical protein HMPREF0262_01452 [Clostridium sp. ATCC 29733]|nr:hypothetical protein HMPREF0262_01452 [Clostridium sp. ATCC 29733]
MRTARARPVVRSLLLLFILSRMGKGLSSFFDSLCRGWHYFPLK